MFDFGIGTSELLLIAMVALIVVGPKELPGLLRTLGQWVGKLKALAADFQNHLDELTKETEVKEIRKKIEEDIGDLSIEDLDKEFAEMEKELREQLAAGAQQPGGPKEASDEDLIEEDERPLPETLDLDAEPGGEQAQEEHSADETAPPSQGDEARHAQPGASEADAPPRKEQPDEARPRKVAAGE